MYKYLEINNIFTNYPRVKGEITMVISEYFKSRTYKNCGMQLEQCLDRKTVILAKKKGLKSITCFYLKMAFTTAI